MKLQEWKSKYEAAKGTPEHFKYVTEYQSKINGRWKFVGHGVPNPERQYDIKKHGGKMYLVSANGNSRFVVKDGNTDFTQYIQGETV